MENFYSLEQKIIEFNFSMKMNISDSLVFAELVLNFLNEIEISFKNPNIGECYYYALMSVLKKIADKKDKKNYKLKLNGSEYYALKGVLEHYHTNLLGDPNEAYTWNLSNKLLEQMA